MAYSVVEGGNITIKIKKDSTSKSYLSENNKKQNERFLTFKNAMRTKAATDAAGILKTQAEYYLLDRNFTLGDNYQAQRDVNNAKTILSNVSTIAKSALIGASAGGPVGAAITAAVAAIGITASAGIALDKQNIKLTQMDTQLSYSREKAGYSLTAQEKGTNL